MPFSGWFMLCCGAKLLWSGRLCPFWTRPPFLPVDMHIFTNCVILFRVTCGMFITLPHIFFFLFSPLLCVNSGGFVSCTNAWFHCDFLFLKWLMLPMLYPIIGPFIFRAFMLSCSFSVRWPFAWSFKMFSLHLDNSTTKVY